MQEPVTKERMLGLFEKNRQGIVLNDTGLITGIRDRAIESFRNQGFPHAKLEEWRHTSLTESFGKGYDYFFKPGQETDIQKVFRCNIPHLDTAIIGQLNGWYVSKDVPLLELGNGIILGSLAAAFKRYPEIIEKHYSKYAEIGDNGFTALNTALAQDGIFIYVPDNVGSPKPIQMVNVIQANENLFLHSRNLIVLGKNSRLSVV
ncbi:MAG TPA: hypothetical protein VMC08_02560, partial [Bacteroidales bacterium]|nr:hypothetical protein [Bacteroidales bacterium]